MGWSPSGGVSKRTRRRPCSRTPAGAAPSTDRRSSWASPSSVRTSYRRSAAWYLPRWVGTSPSYRRDARARATATSPRHRRPMPRPGGALCPTLLPSRLQHPHLGGDPPTPTWSGSSPRSATQGWEGIEMLDNDANWSGPPSRVRQMLERVGLPASRCSAASRSTTRAAGSAERQKRMIDFGAQLGCEAYVFLGGDRTGRRLTTDDDLRRLADVASEFMEYADPRDDRGPPLAPALHGRARRGAGPVAGVRGPAAAGVPGYRDHRLHGRGPHGPDPAVCGADRVRPPQGLGFGKYCVLGEGPRASIGARCLQVHRTGYDGWVTIELSWYGDTTPTRAASTTGLACDG